MVLYCSGSPVLEVAEVVHMSKKSGSVLHLAKYCTSNTVESSVVFLFLTAILAIYLRSALVGWRGELLCPEKSSK